MLLPASPSRLVKRDHFPSCQRAGPPPEAPTHKLPSASASNVVTKSLGKPPSACRWLVNFPSRQQFKPPPSVPIQRFPQGSSARARIESAVKPSRVVKKFHVCPFQRASPSLAPTQMLPARSSNKTETCGRTDSVYGARRKPPFVN